MATATATATATHGGHLELGGVLLDLLLGSGVLGSSRVGSSGRGSHVDCGYGGWYVVGGETRDARGVATRVRGISKLSLAANPHSEQCAADERAASDLTGWPSRSCGAVLYRLYCAVSAWCRVSLWLAGAASAVPMHGFATGRAGVSPPRIHSQTQCGKRARCRAGQGRAGERRAEKGRQGRQTLGQTGKDS